jgi:hypothetical protein
MSPGLALDVYTIARLATPFTKTSAPMDVCSGCSYVALSMIVRGRR